MRSGVAKTIVLGLTACVQGARIVVDQGAATKDGEICVVNGPDGSGLSAAVSFAEGKCYIGCRKYIFGKIENNRLFESMFEAKPMEGSKCACSITNSVSLADDEGRIAWEIPNTRELKRGPCSPAKCWISYKRAYDVGRDYKMMLDRASNYKQECIPDDGSKQGESFNMGITVFHHVKVQATKEPEHEDDVEVANLVAEDKSEEIDEDTEEFVVNEFTTFEQVLDHSFALGATSSDNIKKAAEIIDLEVNVVEDPWKGWNAYLGALGRACNVGIEDLEEMQKVNDWSDPQNFMNRKVCEADREKCRNSLSEYPGLQADGCDDDECHDAIEKIARLFVSFKFCKIMHEVD